MAFPELLRANRLGMSDPLDRALSLMEGRVLTQRPSNFGGIRPMQRQQQEGMQGPAVPDWIRQTQLNARGLPPGVENVVYDQRPELAAKQQALQNRQFERQNELIKTDQERQVRKDLQDTDAYERQRRMNTMTDREKQQADFANRELVEEGRYNRAMEQYAAAQKRVETQQAGATGRTGMTQAGAESRSVRNAQLRRDLQGAKSQAEMDQIMQRYQNDVAFESQFQPRTSLNEKVQAIMGKALDENPDYWKVIEQDDRGNFRIVPPPAGSSGLSNREDPLNTLRSQLTRRVYGPQEVPLNAHAGRGLMRPGDVVDPNAPKDYSGTPQPAAPTAPVQRRQPQNQTDLARLAVGIKNDFQQKKGRPPSEQELEAIMAHYLGGK